jgi:O-antigen ligase
MARHEAPAVALQPTADRGAATLLSRIVLALFALGIPLDVVLATQLGSSSIVSGVPLALGAAWQILSIGRLRTLPGALLFATAFTAWAAASGFWTSDWYWYGVSLTVMVQLLAFVILSWQMLRSHKDLTAMLAGFVAGCAIAALDVWRAFLSGQMVREMTRYAAEAYDPNDMAVTLAIGIPAAGYLALVGTRKRYWALGYLPLAGSAIMLSGSRAGVVTAAIGIAWVGVWTSRYSGRALTAVLLLIVGGMVFAWRTVPENLWTRVFTIGDELSGGDLNGRAAIWRAGLEVFASHPIAGVGQGGFGKAVSPALYTRAAGHSTLLPVAAELGLVGLALFVAAFASAVPTRRVGGHDRWLAWSLVTTWGVGSGTLSWELRKTTWFVLLIATALRAMRPSTTNSAAGAGDARGSPSA